MSKSITFRRMGREWAAMLDKERRIVRITPDLVAEWIESFGSESDYFILLDKSYKVIYE